MQARMATYGFSGDANDLARRTEEGILPILKSHGVSTLAGATA
jgi:hypothetical protein